jgi:hypothetical protein
MWMGVDRKCIRPRLCDLSMSNARLEPRRERTIDTAAALTAVRPSHRRAAGRSILNALGAEVCP